MLRPEPTSFARHATLIAIAIVTLIMIVATLTTFLQSEDGQVDEDQVFHTYKSTGHIQLVSNKIEDVELSLRGYVIAGDAKYLAPYDDAFKDALGKDAKSDKFDQHHSIPEELKLLRGLMSDNTLQLQNLDELDSDIQELKEHWGAIAQNRERPETKVDMSSDNFLREDQLMGQVRSLIGIMLAEENHLLTTRLAADVASGELGDRLTYSGIAAFYAIMVLSIILYQRGRRNAERVLSESETRLRAVVENAADGIVLIDNIGVIEDFNPACRNLFRFEESEILGKNISVLMPEVISRFHLTSGSQGPLSAQVEGFDSGTREVRGVRKDGSSFDVDLRISAVRLPLKIIYMGIVRDITEAKEADQTRRQLIARLTDSNTELERFAYVASHDMQEPLRMITNFSALIGKEYGSRLDSDGQEYLALVRESSIRMQSMVEDLLEYARVGNDATRFVTLDCEEEFQHVLDNLAESIREHGAVITHDNLPRLKGNPVQFMRLLQNLIGNGLKYQPKQSTPQVHVGVEENDREWHFLVQDNGIGMEQEYANQVFEPFKRLHTWREYKGTGIGLAICKKIVEQHGGRIWVQSAVDQGSTFHFTLPKSKPTGAFQDV